MWLSGNRGCLKRRHRRAREARCEADRSRPYRSGARLDGLRPGKWWRRPEIVQILTLSEEQQEKLETIFRNASSDLIDLRGEVEKQNINLHGELDQQQLDRAVIRRDAQKLSDARGRLFERELTMLIDMRAVLNDSQWNRMRNGLLDRLGKQAQPPKANGQ